jgi:hypothetical protein
MMMSWAETTPQSPSLMAFRFYDSTVNSRNSLEYQTYIGTLIT